MKVKRIITTVLVMMLIISTLAACGQNTTNESSTTTVGNTVSTQQTTAVEKADPFGKYSPEIEVSCVRFNPGVDVKYETGEDINNNGWTKYYKDRLGINLKVVWEAEQSQFATKSNIMIASGDIPDVFMADVNQFKQLAESDLLADMTSAYESYSSDLTKQVMTSGGTASLDTARINGKLMAIPFTGMPLEGGAKFLYIRTDWLKNLNLQEPKTMDDVIKIAEAFTKNDPDGNGKADTFGFALENNDGPLTSFDYFKGFFNSYHAYPNLWVKDSSGKLVYGSILPEVKTALKALQDLYSKGAIDKEFSTKDLTKMADTIISGKAGMTYGQFWFPNWPYGAGYVKDNKLDIKAFPLLSSDDKSAMSAYDLGINGYWVVKKGIKNPEAIVKMLNLYTEMQYGEKDLSDDLFKQLNTGANGSANWKLSLVQAYSDLANYKYYTQYTDILNGKMELNSIKKANQDIYGKIVKFVNDKGNADPSQWGMFKIYLSDDCSLKVLGDYQKNNLFVMNEYYGAPTSTMSEKNATLYKLQNEAFTRIIMGSSLDEFDKFVEQWKAQGGDTITNEVNDWYSKK